MESTRYAIEQPVVGNRPSYNFGLDALVIEVIRGVDADMRRLPAHMVYEMIDAQLSRRLPGIPMDREPLREAAAKIAIGIPV